MVFFFFIPLLFFKTFGFGEIRRWDYEVDYNNANYAKKFSFGFSLQNGLSATDYLKVFFPFKLHSTLVGNTPTDMTVSVYSISSKDCGTVAKYKTNIYFLSADSETFNYYIKVLDELGQSSKELIPESFYKIEFFTTSPEFQYARHYPPVKISSISEVSLSPIVYDYNFNFANIMLVPEPPTTLTLATTIVGSQQIIPDGYYDVNLEIKPSISFAKTGIRFRFFHLKKEFNFNSFSCTSFSKNVTKTVNGTSQTVLEQALDLSNFTCDLFKPTGEGTITMKIPVSNETTYRFVISVRNPKYVSSGGGFEVRMLNPYTNTIIERNVANAIFSTANLNWGTTNQNLKIKLGWGVNPFMTNAPPEFVVLRSNTGTVVPFYNSLKFEFFPNLSTPPGLKIKIILDLTEAAGFTVLTGSISENLPQFDNIKPVKCILDTSTLTSQKITCEEVGVLAATGLYHIAMRAKFPYDATQPDVNPNFGKISVYSWNPELNAYDSNLLILPARFTGSLLTRNNAKMVPNLVSNGYGAIHSQTGTFISAITALNYGVKYLPGTNQRIVFVIQGDPTPFGTTGAVGIKVYVSNTVIKNKFTVAAPSTYLPADSTLGASLRGRGTEDTSTDKKWTTIQIWGHDNSQFTFGMMNNFATRTFGLTNFEIINQAGIYPDDYCFDVYGGGYNDMYNTPVFKLNFGFNAYTISSSPIGDNANTGNIKMSIVNFWTGTTGNSNLDGSLFPAFLRITGYLPASDLTLIKKISVFFDYANYFPVPNQNNNQVYCSTTFPSASCYGYDGEVTPYQSIFNVKRIDVTVGNFIGNTGESSNFQILIPIATIENQAIIKIFLATQILHPVYGDIKPYMKVFQTFQNILLYSKTATNGALTSSA